MSDEDKVTETLALLADTLRELSGAVEHIAYRLGVIEGEMADTCFLEGCGNPANQHGLCDEHTPRAIQ